LPDFIQNASSGIVQHSLNKLHHKTMLMASIFILLDNIVAAASRGSSITIRSGNSALLK